MSRKQLQQGNILRLLDRNNLLPGDKNIVFGLAMSLFKHLRIKKIVAYLTIVMSL